MSPAPLLTIRCSIRAPSLEAKCLRSSQKFRLPWATRTARSFCISLVAATSRPILSASGTSKGSIRSGVW